ncbi:lytic transglycosylase domain-containing protein [Burkholderia vietnamiensis]|uniref:lytic transglycosylase domain-containing protein n=1 Tax=Burkholderia vietnamiensis TaxID=60552 RepID=UPI000B20CEF8|nr:lytic transglycosylase domain-containing protein [Burkholderia vietnamiensis]
MTDKHPPKQPPKKPEPDAKPAYTPLAWSYPFSPSTQGGASPDTTDPLTYMQVLATAEDGFYPLGASGIWHGGIHFGQKTGEALKQDEGIRAIATGEVVAYRLDKEYPTLTYQDQRHALYSRGFVLIRHTLQLPPAPKKPEPAPAPSNAPTAPASGNNATPPAPAPTKSPAPSGPPPGETLTFFSLYMHTLDWKTYKAMLDQTKTDNAAAKASQFTLPPYLEVERSYRALKPNAQGVPKPKPVDPSAAGDDSLPQPDGNDSLPQPVSGVRVRIIPNGKLLGLLPEGTELTVNEADNGGRNGWAKITKIIKGDPVGPIVGQPPDVQLKWGYVFVSELEPIPQSGPVDKVVVLKKPYPVKAGDIVAHIGQYQRYREAKHTPPLPTRPLLHLEVFAGPDLPTFIAKSQLRAKELSEADPNMEKPFLEILAGAKLVTKVREPDYVLQQTGLKLAPVSDSKSRWVKVQPKTVKMPAPQPEPPAPAGTGKKHKPKPAKKPEPIETPIGSPFWIDSGVVLINQLTTAPIKGWKDFPLKVSQADGPAADFRNVFQIVELEKPGPQNFAREDKDASGKAIRWWNVTLGTKDGGTLQGWARERDHPKVTLCSPWDWPGFELVDNSSTTMVDMFKRYLFVAGLAMGEDQDNFKPSADALATSDLIQKLEKAIDTNHDGKVTAAELADAQKMPWLAEAISHIVVKSESEWGGNMGKWEDITPYMKLVPWKWQNEMERIKKLQWWEEVQGIDATILPKEPKPWHFHPIGLIGNFACGDGDCIPLVEAQRIALFISASFENGNPKFDGCADNFDGMGMSFGLIQWNFGMNTLGPVLKKMHDADPQAFEAAFAPGTNYQAIWSAIISGDFAAQKNWAIAQQNSNRDNWHKTFKAIGSNEKFQEIQIKEAAKYHQDILSCLKLLRELRPDLMKSVQLVTYCALYDLCVQQHDLSKASHQIAERVATEKPATQIELLKIAVQERAKTANPKWIFDATSRRMGIIQQKPYPHPPVKGEKPMPRDNINFKLLSGKADKNVCGL